MKLLIAAIGALLVAIIALIVVWALWRASRLAARRLLANAEKEARRIRARAEIDGQRIQKDGEILVRERLLAARTEFEHETRDYRIELDGLARELDRRERELAASLEELTAREADLGRLAATLGGREAAVVEAERRAEAAAAEQRARLEQISGMTADQARSELMRGMEHEARMEAAGMIRRVEEEATEKAKDKARRVISMAIQRIASEHVVESTVAVVDLPSDEMKGRIIGREGRNIRAFEQATGVDLIVDDTPEAVILSCFEPVRREIARLALTNLIQDGRIHPGRIEELVAKVQTEMDEKLLADGEAAALEAGIPDLHPELQKLIGRLQFRSSFGQNALKHSLEVSWLAHHMAAELGVNAKVAGRAGLLHDIGKA
ncbi:MAG TPA: Rnase Y domain-containing protein, partial [Thermoanaerobaculales bacterium]|nr:Rnase Y domain-containing protein [Thermoanaerobaculales bacterium]